MYQIEEDGESSKNTKAIEINKAKRTNLFNPRTRTGRGTRLCRHHLDRPYLWRSIRVVAAPASGRIEVMLPAPVAPNRDAIGATTSGPRDLDLTDGGRSAGKSASPGFCRHERFLAPDADRPYAPPHIYRRASQVFAVGRCRDASCDRTRCTAADWTYYRVVRHSHCRYRSNVPPRRSQTGAGSSYRSTLCR